MSQLADFRLQICLHAWILTIEDRQSWCILRLNRFFCNEKLYISSRPFQQQKTVGQASQPGRAINHQPGLEEAKKRRTGMHLSPLCRYYPGDVWLSPRTFEDKALGKTAMFTFQFYLAVLLWGSAKCHRNSSWCRSQSEGEQEFDSRAKKSKAKCRVAAMVTGHWAVSPEAGGAWIAGHWQLFRSIHAQAADPQVMGLLSQTHRQEDFMRRLEFDCSAIECCCRMPTAIMRTATRKLVEVLPRDPRPFSPPSSFPRDFEDIKKILNFGQFDKKIFLADFEDLIVVFRHTRI